MVDYGYLLETERRVGCVHTGEILVPENMYQELLTHRFLHPMSVLLEYEYHGHYTAEKTAGTLFNHSALGRPDGVNV